MAGLVVAQMVAAALAGVAGALTAPLLSPNARALIVAVALVACGIGAMFPARIRKSSGRGASPLGGFVEGLAATLGDRASFLIFALALGGSSPIAAAAGGVVAAVLVAGVVHALGETRYLALPLRPFERGAGLLLAAVGIFVGLGALRLI